MMRSFVSSKGLPLLLLTLALILSAAMGLHAHAMQTPPLQGQVVLPDGQKPAADLALQDQNGHVVTMKDLRGHVVAITFLDSHCVQQCPIVGRELALVEQRLGPHTPLTLLVVSVAPFTDSPASAAAFALKSGWQGDWHWLFGTPTQLAKVWHDYGIWVQPTKKEIMHTAVIYLVSPNGSVRVMDMLPFLPDQMVQSVKNLTHQAPKSLLDWITLW